MLNRNKLLKWFNIWAIIICLLFQALASVIIGVVMHYFFLYAVVALLINQYIISKGKNTLAFFVFLLTINTLVIIFDEGLQSNTASFVFYIPLILGTLILADPDKLWHRMCALTVSLGSISLTNFSNLTPRLAGLMDSGNTHLTVAVFNIVTAIILSVVIVLVLVTTFVNAHKRLLESKQLLERNEQFLQSINHNIDIAICRTSVLNNRFIYVNNAQVSMFGYATPEEMLNMNPDEVYANPGESRRIQDEINEHGRVKDREVLYKRKDGSTFWGLLTSAKTIDVNGMLIYDGALRDITNIKKLRDELLQAKEAAEKSSLAKSQFLSSISHEIRTPMNAVIGASNLLLMDNPKPEQVENILLLQSAGTSLMRLINNVLDFSKIELGKIELENVPVDLLQLIKEVLSTHKIEASKKGIRLAINTTLSHDHYLIDSLRLTQVLNNLLSNALKFTENGEVILTIEKRQNQNDSDILYFEVRDTGIGIASERQEKIFESFSQEEAETTRKFGGTGLGLAITKDILKLMNAAIHVSSEKGKGSAFSFTLALKKHQKPVIERSASREESDYLKGMRILVVEDNKINIAIIKKFLLRWEIECTVAESGDEALEIVKQKEFDLVLMDLHMPGMDGYQTAGAMRAMNIKTPIFALTADAFNETRISALASGMNDFIPKPFNPGELYEKLINIQKNRLSSQ
jgi:PAS domain S-box-containing protein